MYNRPPKRRQLIQRIIVYAIMTVSVFTLVIILTMFMLGYRLNFDKGNIEQLAFLQFSSTPSGATVSIDGHVIGSKTPNKSTVSQGKHDIVMWRDGYETWSKSVDVKSGTLTWLNYAILVPKNITVEAVAKYKSIVGSLAAPKNNHIILQQNSSKPTFELVDIGSDTPVIKSITIPTNVFSVAASHSFKLEKWDDDGRYVLVSHKYAAKYEWLVIDTQDINSSKNITKTFDIGIDKISFAGTSGNSFYVLTSGDIRKLDLSAGTISKPVVSNVTDFNFYNESKVVTWTRNVKSPQNPRSVGIYREGDESPSTISSYNSDTSTPIHIATVHYFNEDYIVTSEGNKINILKGSYPNTTSDNSSAMKSIAQFNTPTNASVLEFSPDGQFVFVRSGNGYSTYDLEYQKSYRTEITGTNPTFSIKWLDHSYLWDDRDGKLTILEFDGANSHTINSVITGQDVTLTNNGRYLYSIGKSGAEYNLQRVRMILP